MFPPVVVHCRAWACVGVAFAWASITAASQPITAIPASLTSPPYADSDQKPEMYVAASDE